METTEYLVTRHILAETVRQHARVLLAMRFLDAPAPYRLIMPALLFIRTLNQRIMAENSAQPTVEDDGWTGIEVDVSNF